MTIEIQRLDARELRVSVQLGTQREQDAKAFKQARVARNAATFAKIHADNLYFGRKLDSRSRQNAGLLSARQLEQILTEVERTEYPANNWLDVIPTEAVVKPGADSFTVQRIDRTGTPVVHKGKGTKIPNVSVNMHETNFKVRAYVLGAEWDYFEMLSSDFANANLQTELLTAVRDSHLEFLNEKTGLGDEDNDIHGILNNPYVNKIVLDTIFSEGTDGDLMLAALNRIVNAPNRLSKGKRKPSALGVSVRVDDIIAKTPRASGTDLTVKEAFLRANPQVRQIIPMHELDNAGGEGVDGFFGFSPEDRKSCVNVIPIQYTQLPVQQSDFNYNIPTFLTHGGILMRQPLGNIVAFAQAQE